MRTQLAPKHPELARAPTALPSTIQSGATAPVRAAAGGRRMLVSRGVPDCCNTYIVQPTEVLATTALNHGQPFDGVRIMQGISAFPLHS